MRIVVVTPPEPIVSLDEMKQRLGVAHDDDDAMIFDLIAAATAYLDGPDGTSGLCLGEQTLELYAAWMPEGVRLPCGPVLAIEGVALGGCGLADMAIPPAAYVFRVDGVLSLLSAVWPVVTAPVIRVRYRAGYPFDDDERSTVPPPIRLSIMMAVARSYAARGEPMAANLVEDPRADAVVMPSRVFG